MADAWPGGLSRLILLACVAAPAPGCALFRKQHTLETGYQYQPLNSTSVQRRAFYADPYSIEARRAEAERQQRARDMGTLPGLQ
jgi:hypothetical protein